MIFIADLLISRFCCLKQLLAIDTVYTLRMDSNLKNWQDDIYILLLGNILQFFCEIFFKLKNM